MCTAKIPPRPRLFLLAALFLLALLAGMLRLLVLALVPAQ